MVNFLFRICCHHQKRKSKEGKKQRKGQLQAVGAWLSRTEAKARRRSCRQESRRQSRNESGSSDPGRGPRDARAFAALCVCVGGGGAGPIFRENVHSVRCHWLLAGTSPKQIL